eukprot:TRINITY_DN27359_c0_g2_i1.p1 TRINITY_DN27359_c0_g2~~TRINITY_DN27359_c0_g2_i1.p1  ORF type:complete len:630 (-),score=149.68 TRINITY_DN27359_c0_g2_i1:211-2049(-)
MAASSPSQSRTEKNGVVLEEDDRFVYYTGVEIPKDDTCRVLCARIISSRIFRSCIGFVMIFNMLVVIVETDMKANGDVPLYLRAITTAILVIYCVELTLRIFVAHITYFKSSSNVFDFLIILVDVLAEVLVFLQLELPSVSIMRVFRIVRAIKGMRALWSFRELYMMMFGFFGSMRAIAWATLVIYFMICIWSIIFVELVHPINLRVASTGIYDGCDRCPRAFSTVFDSMVTLTQQIVAGDSWGTLSLPIIEEQPFVVVILLPALLTVQLGLMNLVLAVIVDAAESARSDDVDYQLQTKKKEQTEAKEKLLDVCAQMDIDQGGSLSIQELYQGFEENQEFMQQLHLMDIGKEDLAVVFAIMDQDKSGTLDYHEFVDQLYKMKSQDQQTILTFLKYYVLEIRESLVEQLQLSLQGVSKDTSESNDMLNQVMKRLQMLEESMAEVKTWLGGAASADALGGAQKFQGKLPEKLVSPPPSAVDAQRVQGEVRRELERLQDRIFMELGATSVALTGSPNFALNGGVAGGNSFANPTQGNRLGGSSTEDKAQQRNVQPSAWRAGSSVNGPDGRGEYTTGSTAGRAQDRGFQGCCAVRAEKEDQVRIAAGAAEVAAAGS